MKLSKKYKKFYEKEMRKLSKMKKMISRHHQQQQQHQHILNTSGTSKHRAYKLPLLTKIELMRDDPAASTAADPSPASSTTVFNDYLLVPSKTKFKHLLIELFDQAKLDVANDKSKLRIVDGYLKVKNWQPVNLNSITPGGVQCQTTADTTELHESSKNNSDSRDEDNNNKLVVLNNNGDKHGNSSNATEHETPSGERQQQQQRKSRKTSDGKSHNSSGSGSMSFSSSSSASSRSSSINNVSRSSSLTSSSLSVSTTDSSMSGLSSSNLKSKKRASKSKASAAARSATVYEVLSHVVSFAAIIIKVKLKSDNDPGPSEAANLNGQSQSTSAASASSSDLLKQHLLLQTFLQTSNTAIKSELNENLTAAASSKSGNLIMASASSSKTPSPPKSSASSNKSAVTVKSEQEAAQSNDSSQQQLIQNQLYANSQLANLLPLFNIPIIGQLLNGLKNQQQQQQYNSQDGEPSSGMNLPLNLCKDGKQPKRNSDQSTSSFISSSSFATNKSVTSTTAGTAHATALKSQASPSPSVSSIASSTGSSSNMATSSNNNNKKSQQSHITPKSAESMLASVKVIAGQHLPSGILNHHHAKLSTIGLGGGSSSSRKQRERTTFDPHEEITRLMQIFERTHHPTRYQIANICEFLNGLACRKDKKPLEPYNIQYWFKNARAALRRKSKGDSTTTSGGSQGDELHSAAVFNPTAENDHDIIEQILKNRPAGSAAAAGADANYGYYANEDDEDDDKYSDFDDEDDEDISDEEFNNNEEDGEPVSNSNIAGGYATGSMFASDEGKRAAGLNNDDQYDNDLMDSNDNDVDNNFDYQDENDDYEDDEGNGNGNDGPASATGFGRGVGSGGGKSGKSSANRRNRVFIDPISEVPILEHYFSIETYPDHYLIEKICDTLNSGEYRHKFPKLESRNIQLWFKNHRAKLKRVKLPSKNE